MATAKSQELWRQRKADGLIRYCAQCDRRLRIVGNSSATICHACWKQTAEGKAHLALVQRLRRLKGL